MHIYIYIYRRLGRIVQPRNRFVSFVRARSCMYGLTGSPKSPSSLFLFPLHPEISVFSLPPSPQSSYPTLVGLIGIGHRLRQQPGLDESSGRNLETFLHGVAFSVYLMFSKTGKNTWCWHIVANHFLQKRYVFKKLWQAWNAVREAWGYQTIRKLYL